MKNYEVMNKDTVTAIWQDDQLSVNDHNLLPLFLTYYSDANKWLVSRAVDSRRANSRLLKKALRLSKKDDLSTVIKANGATITDTYWIRPIGSTTTYEEICFDAESFKKLSAKAASNIALKGNYQSFNYVASHTSPHSPELTNIGSYEKCWKNIDGQWWMYKKATPLEIFTEVFISKLCDKLGIKAAIYEKGEKCVKSLDFTDGAMVCFEPASSFMNDTEDYEAVIGALEDLCPWGISKYIQMIFIDALIANPDRHTGNFGLLRDPDSGDILDFAPLFDHNMALIANGYPHITGKSDMLISLFADVIHNHPEYEKAIPNLTRDMIASSIQATNMNVRSKVVEDYVYTRYELIMQEISKPR